MEENRYFVYVHINKIDNKKYVGITGRKKPEWRWGQQGQKYKENTYFKNAIDKYGWDNFEHIILYDKLTKEEAKEKEKEIIKKYNSNNRAYGYNLTAGGDDFSNLSGENNPKYGTHLSEETKKKMSAAQKKRKHSEEEIRNSTNRLLNYVKEYGNGWKDKHHTLETKEKLRIKSSNYFKYNKHPKQGNKLSEESKNKIAEGRLNKGLSYPIICIETQQEFISIRSASKEMGISKSCISDCCKGKRDSTKGYHFKYKDDINLNCKTKGYKRKVICVETKEEYSSLSDAARALGVDKSNIWNCCQNNTKTIKGFHFKYL